MKTGVVIGLGLSLLLSSAASAEKAPCPPHEAGASYPWDVQELMKGDKYASVFIDVDRTGRPLGCKVGNTNITDSYTLFLLCDAYKDSWRAPAAAAGDPDRRTIRRDTTLLGGDHELANQKARKAWFKAHPEERPSCYPED
ncbi:MAG: hypothetical protein ACM3ZV_05995 [Bacillota bacterium]